jgi:hypothetical protein
MNKTWKGGLVVGMAAGIAVALLLSASLGQRAMGRAAEGNAGAPHYSVVITEGHNLLVSDNANNTLYFYAKDKDKPIGSPLKLRASLDLGKVGEPEIKITAHNLEEAK